MNNKYLELDQKNGRFFEYSKDEKDGFEKHTTDSGKVSYRKTYDKGVIGKLKFINEKENDFGKGKFKSAQLVVESGDDRMYLTVQILNAKGGLNEYFEQLATILPNMKVGETYRIFPYTMEVPYENKAGEKKTATNRGFSVHAYDVDNDVKLDKVERAHNYGKDGDIPDVVWTPETDMGVTKNVKDDKARRNFLYEVFKQTLSADNTPKSETPKEESAAPKTAEKEVPVTNFNDEEDNDDLPF